MGQRQSAGINSKHLALQSTPEFKAAKADFEKNSRFQGGEYLIECKGKVLVEKTPRDLWFQYWELVKPEGALGFL